LVGLPGVFIIAPRLLILKATRTLPPHPAGNFIYNGQLFVPIGEHPRLDSVPIRESNTLSEKVFDHADCVEFDILLLAIGWG
jgi:hypothetical protein